MVWMSGSFVDGSASAAVAGFAWMDAETRRTSSMVVHDAYFGSSSLDLGSGRTEKDSACDSLREESEAERLRRSERWWDLRDVRARWVCVTSGRRNRYAYVSGCGGGMRRGTYVIDEDKGCGPADQPAEESGDANEDIWEI